MDTLFAVRNALRVLGRRLEERGTSLDVVIVGGAALMLGGHHQRPSEDVDVLAVVDGEQWSGPRPLPEDLVRDVRTIGMALGLPVDATHGQDWFNAGPAMLIQMILPDGMPDRCTTEQFHALTVRVPHRKDLIALKLLSASGMTLRRRREVDLTDLRTLQPTPDEWAHAISFSLRWNGLPDAFEVDLLPTLQELGARDAIAAWRAS